MGGLGVMLFCSCIQYIGILPRYYSRDSSMLHPNGDKEPTPPERSSCIADLGVWALHHWSIVAEDSKMVLLKLPTRSARSRPRWRHFPVVFLYLAPVEARTPKKNSDLLIHTSFKISRTRIMARTTRYQRHIDNAAKHRQL
jgi:hypothetical protein